MQLEKDHKQRMKDKAQSSEILKQQKELDEIKKKEQLRKEKLEAERKLAEKLKKEESLLQEMQNQGQLPVLTCKYDSSTFSFNIDSPKVNVGREKSNTIVVNNNHMSRNHFTIFFSNGNYYIKDNNSSNGIIVNGVKVNDSQLENGDIIEVADIVFTFVK